MKIAKLLSTLLIVTTLVAAACGPSGPASPPEVKTPATQPVPKATEVSATQSWDRIVAEAKKEGILRVYGLWRPDTRDQVGKAFKNKYGIDVDFLTLERGNEITARLQAEKSAGLYLADILGVGATTLVTSLKPAGLLDSLDPYLMLPDAKDAGAWRGGKIPFYGQDHYGIGMMMAIQRYVGYNTQLVKEGEITSYKDVLKPQYKGKITVNDPTVPGAGIGIMAHLAVDIWDEARALDFLRQLLKNEPAIERDIRVQVEAVARGKYAISLGPTPDVMVNFIAMGAPLSAVMIEEGLRTSPSTGALGLPLRSEHRNAAILFLNWILTREGQTVLSASFGQPSLRADVPTEGINPLYLPRPGEKLYPDTESWQLAAGALMGKAKQVIEEARR